MSGPRLRIAVLSRHFDPSAGGAERYAVSLVQRLAGRHEIHVYAQQFGIDIPGVARHPVPAGPSTRWLNQLWFALHTALACGGRYDIVHSHEATWFGNVQTVHVRPIKVNLFAGRPGPRRWLKWLSVVTSPRLLSYLAVERARLMPTAGRAVIAVSPTLRREMVAAYPALAGVDIPIVPPGVTPLPAGEVGERGDVRAHQRVGASDFVLLFVANDHGKKGLPTLLKALVKLPDAFRLWVVGAGTDLAASRRQAAALGLEERVRFVGRVANPGPLYRAADLLVHPALEDTFGMVVPEAMSQGLPVLVSTGRWCGVADGLRHGVDAWLLDEPRDAQALSDAINLLRGDAALRARLSDAGREFVGQFDWDDVALRQEALYQHLVLAR